MRISLICTLFICLFIPYYSNSQQVVSTSEETEWQLRPVVSNGGPSFDWYYARTFKNAVLQFDKIGSVLPIQNKKDEFGIVLADPNGNIKWEVPTKGSVLGQSKLGKNILCFYSPEWNTNYPRKIIQTIYAGLYDAKNGRLIKEKIVFENKTDLNVDSKILVTPDGQFGQLLIRYTPYSKISFSMSSSMEKFKTTEKLSVITLSESLDATISDISSAAQEGEFIGCISLSPQEFAVGSRLENSIITEKFNLSSLAKPEKYTMTVNARHGNTVNAIFQYSPEQPGVLYEALRYENTDKDRSITLFKLDLNTKKTESKEIVMNRQLAETMADDPEAKKSKLGKVIDKMDLVDIAVMANKVILLTQVRFVTPGTPGMHFDSGDLDGSSPRHDNNQIMLSVFDNALTGFHSMIIDRNYELFLQTGEKIGWKISGSDMHLLYNVSSGTAKVSAEYTVVDLNNLKVIQKERIEKEGLRKDANIEPEAVIWSENNALVPYNNMAGVKNGHTIIQKISLKK